MDAVTRPHAAPATGAPASPRDAAAPLVTALRQEAVTPAAEDRAAREGRLSSALAAGG